MRRPNIAYSTNFIKKQAENKSKKKFDKRELENCIEKLKRTSAKNTEHLNKGKHLNSDQPQDHYTKQNKGSSKQRQTSIRRLERVLSNKQESIRRSSKNSNINKNNVYDSFSMSNIFLEVSTTPDNKVRYSSNNNLINTTDIRIHKR